ncbi:MAG: hypothetical protein P6H82_03530 [Candidatus Arsenophonus melophagi]|nr:hypothetical protein [Candidatus Arsenophonus melophagi]
MFVKHAILATQAKQEDSLQGILLFIGSSCQELVSAIPDFSS